MLQSVERSGRKLACAVDCRYERFRYFAYYDYYASCRPDLKVVFLVLSILFPVTLPFFVFACRKHDLGMEERPKTEASIAGLWADERAQSQDL